MPEPILDPKHPRLARFLERLGQLNTAQWLIICDRFVARSTAIAKAQGVAASFSGGADAPRSMRQERLRAMDDLLRALAEILQEMPPHTRPPRRSVKPHDNMSIYFIPISRVASRAYLRRSGRHPRRAG